MKTIKIICVWLCLSGVSFAQDISTLVQSDSQIAKEHGFQNILQVHENIIVNPFQGYQIIREMDGEEILGYKIGGRDFDTQHDLYIAADDSDIHKTMQAWSEESPGIYSKILLQEASYELVDGVITPNQSVLATKYYKVLYNFDSTAPVCDGSIRYLDPLGTQKSEVSDSQWHNTDVYSSFVCSDPDSACVCEEGDTTCTIQDGRVLSVPQKLQHNMAISYDFQNTAGMMSSCDTPDSELIFYDRTVPELAFYLDGNPMDTSSEREYVNNNGVLYDGVEIESKKYYNIQDAISLIASSEREMEIHMTDIYNPGDSTQGVSGMKYFEVRLAQNVEGVWTELAKFSDSLEDFNPQGEKEESHQHIFRSEDMPQWKESFYKSGNYQLYVYVEDLSGNASRVIQYYNVVPSEPNMLRSRLSVDSKSSIYSYGAEAYHYTLYLRDEFGNPIYNKTLFNFEHDCDGIDSCQSIYQYTTSGYQGQETLEVFDIQEVSGLDGRVEFKVRSLAPGRFTERFSFELLSWDENYEDMPSDIQSYSILGAENLFLSPFVGVLESKVSGAWQPDLILNSEQNYRLKIIEKTPAVFDGSISDFEDDIQVLDSSISSFSLTGSVQQVSSLEYHFTGSLISTETDASQYDLGLQFPATSGSGIIVSYVVDGQSIRHVLSGEVYPDRDITLRKMDGSEPVEVFGAIQGVGNHQIYADFQNLSDSSRQSLGEEFRKNAFSRIMGLSHGSVAGGVKFIDGAQLGANKNYTIEANPSYETLVVLNANVHIAQNLNTSENKLGIIVLLDEEYDLTTGYSDIGNVYIDSNVQEIHSFIYAEGAIVATQGGSPFTGGIPSRQANLIKQLYIKGAIWSKNTLGGATMQDGTYILPGNEETQNQNLALQYDLRYHRRGNQNCYLSAGLCLSDAYLVIDYDTRIQLDPPVLFSQ